MKHGRFLKVFLWLLLAPVICSPVRALAAPVESGTSALQIFDLQQKDLNGDGAVDVTEITCDFATERDRVLVYDFKGMPSGEDWEQVTDFRDDLWVFDTGDDGTAQLIIQFAEDEQSLWAYVYDDVDGDGQVSYEIGESQVQIVETRYSRIRVTAAGAWTLADGRPNPNIKIYIDSWGNNLMDLQRELLSILVNPVPDGILDWEYEIVDDDGDGDANYQLGRLLADIPSYQYPFRSSLFVDQNPAPSKPYADPIFWPYLAKDLASSMYFERPPAISVNWETGAITGVGIPGYPAEQGYHLLSMSPWQKNQANRATWENPMAYYDLAGDMDSVAEFMIRVVLPVNIQGSNPLPDGAIGLQYAWDQDNDGRWNYQIALGGNKPITRAVEFQDFSLYTIPYHQLPGWVVDQDWDVALLTVVESGGYGGSEALWHWLVTDGQSEDGNGASSLSLQEGYLAGYSTDLPYDTYTSASPGFRGEYCFEYFEPPRLYFSPVDQRLHLWKAQAGVWNLGEGNNIRYTNLDGDAYLDRWQEEVDGVIVQELNYARGFFIYYGNGGAVMKQVDIQPALFETLPPKNYEEWQSLDAQLSESIQITSSPTDFAAMFQQFVGPELQIQDAMLRDFRITSQGFRFILSLSPAYTFQGENWLDLAETPPGEYLVTYDSEFTLQPLTPPDLRLAPAFTETQALPVIALQSGEVPFRLYNDGLTDAQEVLVTLSASQGEQALYESEPLTVTVYGGESTLVSFPWAPTAPGEWKLTAEARWADGSSAPVAAASQVLQAALAQQPSLEQTTDAFGLVGTWQMVLLWAILIVTAVTVGWLILRSLSTKAASGEDLQL